MIVAPLYRRGPRAAGSDGNPPHRALPRWWSELIIVVALYVLYEITRGLRHSPRHTADRNGRLLLRWERHAHLAPEHALNHALHHLPPLAVAAAYFYATLYFVVTPSVLVWIYRAHSAQYRRARSWLAAATFGALIGFYLFPITPPRLLPGSKIRDTVADVHQWGWWSAQSSAPRGLGGLANEYAAMPSLHVGWALWAGWLIARHARRRAVKLLGVTYPIATTLVVVSTGNHYLADAVAGVTLIIVTGAAMAAIGNAPIGDAHDLPELAPSREHALIGVGHEPPT